VSYRRKARECALQMLYQIDLAGEAPERVLSGYWAEHDLRPPIREFAERLVSGTTADLERIDRLIAEAARNWRFERLALVDRNLLRLAVFELLHDPETPAKVVLNEAIEIAKKFGASESSPFVNGVLDGVRKNLEQASHPREAP
jgi:N utilization substance protein B